ISSIMSPLPTEIIYHIIDQFKNHKELLIQCSVISQVWAHRSRFHLFHTVQLHDNFFAFFKLCSNKCSTISMHVHCLSIDQSQCNAVALAPIISPLYCTLLDKVLTWRAENGASISDLFPKLNQLNLDWIGWWMLSAKAKFTLATGFYSIKKLQLSNVVFDSEHEFQEALCSFPMLEEVYLLSLK
ncbi:hypothetical protein EV360DRAFT_15380, partial [Lentinula raphanica]